MVYQNIDDSLDRRILYADTDSIIEDHQINKFERLFERIDKKQVDKMIEESKDSQAPQVSESAEPAELDEPIKPECTIDDFSKVDLRVADVDPQGDEIQIPSPTLPARSEEPT